MSKTFFEEKNNYVVVRIVSEKNIKKHCMNSDCSVFGLLSNTQDENKEISSK